MAWTKLFKKSKLKPDPRIRWFGKLPTYPDYYSSPADEDWVVEFNDFVMKGFEIFQRRLAEKRLGQRLPISGCIVRLPKSEMTAFATLLDFGGDMRGRPFPMCFYAGVPTVMWPGPTSDHLVSAARVIRDLIALRREVASFINSPGRFESVFSGRQVDLTGVDADTSDGSWVESGRSLLLADWFEAARSGLKVQDCELWVRLVRSWGDNLARLDDKSFEPTLRFPLAMRLPLDVQLAGWLHWLEGRIDLRRRLLSLIVSGDYDDPYGGLTVVAREIMPEDFLLLAPTVTTLPYLDDLSAVGDEEQSRNDHVPRSAEVDSVSAGTWVDFVQAAPG